IRMMPIHNRMVKTEPHAFLFAGFGKFLEGVAGERSGFDAPIGQVRSPKPETVMMFAGDDDVFYAGAFSDGYPLPGIELHGIELRHQFLVLGDGNLRGFHDPFAGAFDWFAVPLAGGDRIKTPMNEHPEARLSKPSHAVIVL